MGSSLCLCCEVTDIKRVKSSAQENHLRGNLVRVYNHQIQKDFSLQMDRELGKGGCGVVVMGESKDTGTSYAIKIVGNGTAIGAVERARLERELKLLKDIDHTNIVRLFSVYDNVENMYFVMELCQGGHLGNLLSRQTQKCIDESWARKLCRQLLSAVAHIHQLGIAHRDIKLQNILIDHNYDRTAQLKLIDFGFGCRFADALPMRTKCGTPYTTAPEVIRERYDERCDVWSVGVVLYIMLSGKRPFEALEIVGPLADAGKASMITNILAGRYHFNHRQWRNVSKEGVHFVRTLLHPDYTTRVRSKEALENPWLSDNNLVASQAKVLKSFKSFRAVSNMKRSQSASELQRTGMVAVVFGLQPGVVSELRSVFQSMDSDASGTVCMKEFNRAMNVLAPELSSDDILRLFNIIDIDHNQLISYTEFLAATLDPREVDIEELSKAFKLLDQDGNGYISKDEMRRILTLQYNATNEEEKPQSSSVRTPSSPSFRRPVVDVLAKEGSGSFEEVETIESKLRKVFAVADVNKDGLISYQEFLFSMTGFDYYLNTAKYNPKTNSFSTTVDALDSEKQREPTSLRSVSANGKSESTGSKTSDVNLFHARRRSSDVEASIAEMSMIEEMSEKSRTPNLVFSKQINNFNSAPNVTPVDQNDYVEEFVSPDEPFCPLTLQGLLAHSSKKYLHTTGPSDLDAPASISGNGTSIKKGTTLAFYEGPQAAYVFGDDRGSKKSNHKRTALDEKELPPGRNNAEDDLVTEFVTDQKILTDRREDRKSSPRKVNSGRSSAKEHKSRDLTTTAVPMGNGGVKVMSVCEKVEDVDLDNEASVMPLFSHQPSFGLQRR